MNLFKKIIAVILAFVMIFIFLVPGFSAAAKKTITDIKIINLPVKTVLYEGEDWFYGTWHTEEDDPYTPIAVPSKYISFTHNPCGGKYPERGMLDMTGLVIEVYYSDGSVVEMEYTEKISKAGYYSANILVSPQHGTEYFVGINTMEVYLAENVKYYDSFDVEFALEKPEPEPEPEPYFGVKDGSTAIIDSNGYITGLKTALTPGQLFDEFLDYKDVEVSVSKADKLSKFLGTGSVINVKYPDGHDDNYTIVIYGDVNGDSAINSVDMILITDSISSGTVLNPVQSKAANVDGVRRITSSDTIVISNVIAGSMLNQTNPAIPF